MTNLVIRNFSLVVIATHRDDDPADEDEEGDEELPEDDLQKKDKKKKPDVSWRIQFYFLSFLL